jgi:hypothetical protein
VPCSERIADVLHKRIPCLAGKAAVHRILFDAVRKMGAQRTERQKLEFIEARRGKPVLRPARVRQIDLCRNRKGPADLHGSRPTETRRHEGFAERIEPRND